MHQNNTVAITIGPQQYCLASGSHILHAEHKLTFLLTSYRGRCCLTFNFNFGVQNLGSAFSLTYREFQPDWLWMMKILTFYYRDESAVFIRLLTQLQSNNQLLFALIHCSIWKLKTDIGYFHLWKTYSSCGIFHTGEP